MKLLALDTSTERLSVAVCDGERVLHEQGAGGAQASARLLPAVQGLLQGIGVPLGALDAIVFGQGPGSFTGLRTACSVAQGLALGAGVPVLPVPTLLAVAHDAARRHPALGPQVVAALDARMGELYLARIDLGQPLPAQCRAAAAAWLATPAGLQLAAGERLVGNAGALMPGLDSVEAWPDARALLALAPALLSAGLAVAAREAWPLYVRDKVAQTTAERAANAARAGAVVPAPSAS